MKHYISCEEGFLLPRSDYLLYCVRADRLCLGNCLGWPMLSCIFSPVASCYFALASGDAGLSGSSYDMILGKQTVVMGCTNGGF